MAAFYYKARQLSQKIGFFPKQIKVGDRLIGQKLRLGTGSFKAQNGNKCGFSGFFVFSR